MSRRTVLAGIIALGTAMLALRGEAQEVTLRVHHFLPPSSVTHAKFIQPWAERVMEQSQGRIRIDIFPAMQLGGRPPQLFDQVRDGVVDIAWTLPGYTSGRFPVSEVFELPFLAGSAEATSQAIQEFSASHLREEFQDIHPLMFHVHGPGTLHMASKPIHVLEDLSGQKVRGPTRTITEALQALGATPVGMPVTEVYEAIARGVVDGAALPWEVTVPQRIYEVTRYHTEAGLYTSVFLFAMNKARYESLPDDLKRVIDDNSGLSLAKEIGRVWDEAEEPGREMARERGNEIHVLPEEEVARWKQATQPVIDQWVADMEARGLDGERMLEEARALIRKYEAAD